MKNKENIKKNWISPKIEVLSIKSFTQGKPGGVTTKGVGVVNKGSDSNESRNLKHSS